MPCGMIIDLCGPSFAPLFAQDDRSITDAHLENYLDWRNQRLYEDELKDVPVRMGRSTICPATTPHLEEILFNPSTHGVKCCSGRPESFDR